MGGKNKGGGGENSKKAQGQARKADAAASKKAAKDQQVEVSRGSKVGEGQPSPTRRGMLLFVFSDLSTSGRLTDPSEAAAEKAAEAARKESGEGRAASRRGSVSTVETQGQGP